METTFCKIDEKQDLGLPSVVSSVEKVKSLINQGLIDKYRKMPPFRKGSKVKLTSKRPYTWNQEGLMDYMLGATKTLSEINGRRIYFVENEPWVFTLRDIEEVIEY